MVCLYKVLQDAIFRFGFRTEKYTVGMHYD